MEEASSYLQRLAVAGLAAGIFVPGGGASSKASHATSHSKATTHVTVTATDFKFTLSKRSAPTGTVIFTVTNKGKLPHDFKIAGKKTPLLSPGHSATLRVTFSKKGRLPLPLHRFRPSIARHEGRLLGGRTPRRPTPTPTPRPPRPPTTVGTANTTVTVDMFDDALPGKFTLSQRTIPSGMVTFVITNKCGGQCSFDLEGIKAGAILEPRAVGDMDGRAGPGHLPLPLRRRPLS